MRRVMVFIDFENFNIAVMSYYRSIGEPYPRLDYNKVPQEIVKLIPGGNELVKTFLCAPKPDDFLAQDERKPAILYCYRGAACCKAGFWTNILDNGYLRPNDLLCGRKGNRHQYGNAYSCKGIPERI